MATDKDAIYVFAKLDGSGYTIIDCVSDWEKEFKTLLSNPKNGLYYCACVYYVSSLQKGLEILDLIDKINPNLRVIPKNNFYNLTAYEAYKILQAIAKHDDRLAYLVDRRNLDVKTPQPAEKPTNSATKPTKSEDDFGEYELVKFANSVEMTKPHALEVLRKHYALKGQRIAFKSRQTFFSTKHPVESYYSLVIRKDKFDRMTYLVLNDPIKKVLHLFKIPKGQVDVSNLVTKENQPDKVTIQILYGDDTYPDILSKEHFKFGKYLICNCSYMPDGRDDESALVESRPSAKITKPVPEKKQKELHGVQKVLGDKFDTYSKTPTSVVYENQSYDCHSYEDFIIDALSIFIDEKEDQLNLLIDKGVFKSISKDENRFDNYLKVSELNTVVYVDGNLRNADIYKLAVDLANMLGINLGSFSFFVK